MSATVKKRLMFFLTWCFPCILGTAIIGSRDFLTGLTTVVISSAIVFGLLTITKVRGNSCS